MKRIRVWWLNMGEATRWRGLMLITLFAGAVIPSAVALSITQDWPGFLLNFGTELGGAFITFILIDMIIASRDQRESDARSREETRQRLIHKLGSTVNTEACRAAEELRVLGWLTDGTLHGAELVGANLEGADLRGARLRGAQLYRAIIRGARLYDVDLSEAVLTGADLSGSVCGKLKLDSAQLNGANLRGCKKLSRQALAGCHRLKGATMPDGCRYDGCYCLDGDLVQLEKHCHNKRLDIDDPLTIAEWYGVDLEVYLKGQEWALAHLAGVREGTSHLAQEFVE